MNGESPDAPDVEVRYEDGKRIVRIPQHWSSEDVTFIEHDLPDALSHHYKPLGPGEPIPLYQGHFRFAKDEDRLDWHGDVAMNWYPSPRVVVSGSRPRRPGIKDLMPDRALGKREWVELPTIEIDLGDAVIPTQPGGSTSSERGDVSITERLTPQVVGDATSLDRITFLVPNGWDAYGGTNICDPDDLTRYWRGRIEAFPAGWHITIDTRPDVDKNFWRRLRDENASAVTHIGQIQRADGAAFDAEDADLVLQALRLAFSLSVGRTVNLLLPVGWRGNEPVWTRWVSPHIDGVKNTGTFLDRHEGAAQMRELIERVIDYCTTPERLEIIQYATSYYVTATYDVDVELGVALPVSGLQLLAYNRFVEERGTYTKTRWNSLPNTEQEIRLLLDDCKIPTGLPATYPHLQAISARAFDPNTSTTPRDALGSVMLLRNKIIHPTSVKPGAWSPYEWAEAGHYGAHCLLLAILNTVGYQGAHRSAWADNIWDGVTEPVPWAAAHP